MSFCLYAVTHSCIVFKSRVGINCLLESHLIYYSYGIRNLVIGESPCVFTETIYFCKFPQELIKLNSASHKNTPQSR